jgi:hypothetical protein
MQLLNIYICIAGWLAWNFFKWSYEKDKYDDRDEHFPFKQYCYKSMDNWLASLFLIPVLLIIGYKGFSLDALASLDVAHLQWSDTYYLMSGFITELGMESYKKWLKKKSS